MIPLFSRLAPAARLWLVLPVLLGVSQTVRAETLWQAGTGDWFTAGNWNPAVVPNSGTGTVEINNGGNAQISQPGASAVFVYLALNAGESGTLSVGSGGTGAFEGLIAGYMGTGTVSIDSGGTIAAGSGAVGFAPGGSGIVTVNGSGSQWTNTGDLRLGYDGNASVHVQNGGLLTDANSSIGIISDGHGDVTVDGAGSQWTNTANLTVGVEGTATVHIQNGGKVTDNNSVIASEAGSVGGVTVDGTGTQWITTLDLTVGNAGVGDLHVQNGGAVSDTNGTIAGTSGEASTATVDGAGSHWTHSGLFVVGENGTGTLSIQTGGAVSDLSAIVGSEIGSTGTAAVLGANSTWSNTSALFVGEFGTGTLNVYSGGAVSDTLGKIAVGSGSVGTATVDGSASTWTNSGNLVVGDLGSGALNLQNGGSASSVGADVGKQSGSTGVATINGTGSHWANTGALNVGNSGNGTLNIQSGGVVTSTSTDIGMQTGAVGIVAVDGALSQLSNSGDVVVGDAGTGTLNVSTQAKVIDVNGSVGLASGSQGTVTVDHATWTNSGDLTVGGAGTGILNLQSGTATSVNGVVGDDSGSHGTVTLDQSGWTNTGSLTVGASGNGALTIQNGSEADSVTSIIGQNAGSVGTVTVSGGATGWITTTLAIGASGSGTLTLANTGAVKVGSSFGTVSLATTAGSVGILNIGSGARAGTLQAAQVTGGAGTATINFRHNQTNYIFQPLIAGTTAVNVKAGTTIFNQAETYTGATTVTGGTLASLSLAGSDVTLTGGSFAPGNVGTGTSVTVKSLTLNGGAIKFDLGGAGTTDLITALNAVTLSAATNFSFNNTGFSDGTYTLLLGDMTGFGSLSGLTFTSNIIGLQGIFGADANGLYFRGWTGAIVPITGPVLSNSAPYLVPTTADFVVTGAVTTMPATGSNTINSLFFDPSSVLSVFNDLAVTSGNLTVGSGSATIQGGRLVTPGDFTKLGAGLLNVLSNMLVHGNTIINGGILSVDGTLTTNGVLVETATWLKGHGIINGNVWNNGTVAPGNSPGTLTVNGNFTQTSSGTLQIEVASATFDRLIVSGHATVAGTLQAVAYGGHKFQYGDRVPFLQAGSISGKFDQITMPNPSKLRGRFLVQDHTGSLIVAPTSYTLVAENQNQRNVARALNSYIGKKGDRDAVSAGLDQLTKSEYGNAFDQIAPGFFQTLTDIVIEQTNAQNQFLAQRISSARLGATGFSVTGLDQAALSVDRDGKSVMDAKGGKDIISQGTATKWGVWVQGNGIFAHVTDVSQVPNYHFNSGGFMVGADYTFGGDKVTTSTKGDGKKAVITSSTIQGSTLVLGIYGGYQGTYSKYDNGGRTSINSALFGGYASYSNGGFYSDAIVGGSYNGYQVSRAINFGTIDRTGQSSPYGGTVTAYLDAGYDFHTGNFTFGPLLSGQYTYAGTAPFTENGADSLDLKVEQQNANSIRTNVGGQIAYTWNVTRSVTLIPSARIFWQHEYLDGPRTIGASLDGGNGPGFDFETSDPSRDSVFAGVGLSANLGDRWNTSVYYNADFGRQDFVSHMISASLGWKF